MSGSARRAVEKPAELPLGRFVGRSASFGNGFEPDRLSHVAARIDQLPHRGLPLGPVGLGQNPVFPAVQINLS